MNTPGPDPDPAVALSQRLLAAARSGGAERREAAAALGATDPAAIRGDAARTAFWLNAYNAALLGMLADRPRSGHLFRHRRLFRTGAIRVGGRPFSLDAIEHGLLRGNARPPYSLRRALRRGDPRLAAAPSRPDPRIHFALNCGARSCPPIRAYSSAGLDRELEAAQRGYLAAESSLDREGRLLELPGLVRLYRGDFGSDGDLIEMAGAALGGEDGRWVAAHARELSIGFSRFDWRLVPSKG